MLEEHYAKNTLDFLRNGSALKANEQRDRGKESNIVGRFASR